MRDGQRYLGQIWWVVLLCSFFFLFFFSFFFLKLFLIVREKCIFNPIVLELLQIAV